MHDDFFGKDLLTSFVSFSIFPVLPYIPFSQGVGTVGTERAMMPPAPAGAVAAFAPRKRKRPAATRAEPRAATRPELLAAMRPELLAAMRPERLAVATRAEPHAAPRFSQLAPWRSDPIISALALETDLVLRRLSAVGSVVILPLARTAAAITEHTAWKACGYNTQADFSRECLDRDSRWLRQLVSLHRTLVRLPALAVALSGADGGRALNQSEVLSVGRVATSEDVGTWIARARQLSLEELRAAVRSASLPAEPSLASRDVSQELELEDGSRVRLRFSIPPDVRWIFEAALELYRCVEGWEAGITRFIPALVAEAASAGCLPPDDFSPRWQGDARQGKKALRQRAAEALRREARRSGVKREGRQTGAEDCVGHGGGGVGSARWRHGPARRRAGERPERSDVPRTHLPRR